MVRSLIVLVGCALVAAPAAAQAPGQAIAAIAPAEVATPLPDDSLARIRKMLERRSPAPLFSSPPRSIPTFRVEIFGHAASLRDLQEQLALEFPSRPWFKPAAYEDIEASMPNLEVFSNIRAARAAWYRHKVAKARREVAAELEAFIEAQRRAPASSAARARLQKCRVPGVEEDLLCGSYDVFENRAVKSGRTIALNIVLMPATGQPVERDALVYLAGGGVVPATRYASLFARSFRQLREHRDVLLVDQRGTGKSNPLDCPGLPSPRHDGGDASAYLAGIGRCRDELSKRADLSLYTTSIAMDDLDEVRAALGYDRLDLMGMSYGTKAAQVYLRQHPSRVRVMTLQGPMPMDAAMWLEQPKSAQAALDLVFKGCAADADCAKAFPDLPREFAAVRERLASQPATVRAEAPDGSSMTVTVTEQILVDNVSGMLGMSRGVRDIPALIHEAFIGDYTTLGTLAAEEGAAPPGARPIAPRGLYLTLACAESIPQFSPADIDGATAGTFMGSRWLRSEVAMCDRWVKARLPAGFWNPVSSDVPALVMAGAFDPTTPPRYAESVAKHFANGRLIILPARSHNDGDACVFGLIQSIVISGQTRDIDTSCVARTPAMKFRLKTGPGTADPARQRGAILP